MDQAKRLIHDLRNALFAVESSARKLVASPSSPSALEPNKVQYYADSVSAGIQSLKSLSQELEEICESREKLDAVHAMPALEVRDYLKSDVISTLTTLYGISINFQEDFNPTAKVVTNKLYIKQITNNLVINAINAGANRMTITMKENARSFDFIFRDNGSGMSDEEISEIGFGLSKSNLGSGAGFRIVRQLTAELGGMVSTPRSVIGFATEIVVTLMKDVTHD